MCVCVGVCVCVRVCGCGCGCVCVGGWQARRWIHFRRIMTYLWWKQLSGALRARRSCLVYPIQKLFAHICVIHNHELVEDWCEREGSIGSIPLRHGVFFRDKIAAAPTSVIYSNVTVKIDAFLTSPHWQICSFLMFQQFPRVSSTGALEGRQCVSYISWFGQIMEFQPFVMHTWMRSMGSKQPFAALRWPAKSIKGVLWCSMAFIFIV